MIRKFFRLAVYDLGSVQVVLDVQSLDVQSVEKFTNLRLSFLFVTVFGCFSSFLKSTVSM